MHVYEWLLLSCLRDLESKEKALDIINNINMSLQKYHDALLEPFTDDERQLLEKIIDLHGSRRTVIMGIMRSALEVV